ncbi:hypothetical protein ATANTOWER_014698 [Ataeniobius toweri]|uniref:Secreted protein n=1 Tax=Ataeniobius toweri TaxID=208326 RepID=A0ABU7B244_9TELE|nr:hypothetical protein [Ataeniobius toweri]
MVSEGNRNCRSFLVFLITVPIYSIRKTDNVLFSHNDITGKPFLGCGRALYPVSPPPPSEQLRLRRFIESIFGNVCRVGMFSQGCMSSHFNEGVFADRVQ